MNKVIAFWALLAGAMIAAPSFAQTPSYGRASTNCTTVPYTYSNGQTVPLLIDLTTGALCVTGNGSGGTVLILPGQFTTLDPDISTVTTGGTPVNAFSAGHCKYGCYVQNPANATVNLCGRDTGTASGTNTNAGTICAGPGQQVTFSPTNNAISVVSSDSSHPFGGKGSQ